MSFADPLTPFTRSLSLLAQIPTSLLTTDITRDTPNNEQVRFIPEQATSTSKARLEAAVAPTRGTAASASVAPLSVGPDESEIGWIADQIASFPKSISQSFTRTGIQYQSRVENICEQTRYASTPVALPPVLFSFLVDDDSEQNEVRHIVLKEALGLDFNSFIPESDSHLQTHFISNVQSSSFADKAGLRDGDRILTVNGVDVTNAIHEDVRRMMQEKKPLQLTVVNDLRYLELIESVKRNQGKPEGARGKLNSQPPEYESLEQPESSGTRGKHRWPRSLTESLISSPLDPKDRSRPPVMSDSGIDSNTRRPKSASPKPVDEALSVYLRDLFVDDRGQVQAKHCVLKKDPSYNGYGLLLRYQAGLHLIDQVEIDSPAYHAGLREDDVILYVDKKNVELMTHDDVKILIKKLSLSNTNIDLILIKKSDVQRYRAYQEKNNIDWKPLLQETNIAQSRPIRYQRKWEHYH